MRAAPRPANISTNEDADCEKKCAPDSWATALASSVLPVPGGPCRSTPLGTLAPRRSNCLGERRKSTTSRSSAFASSTPAMSSQPTSRLASGLDLDRLGLRHQPQRPPQDEDQRDHEEDREDGLPVVGEVADAVEHARSGRDRRQGDEPLRQAGDDLQHVLASLSGVAGDSEQGRYTKHAWCIGSLGGFLQPRRRQSARRFDAQDLGQRRAADLELLLGRLARAQDALELVPGPAQRARQGGLLVALGPREDLDRGAERGELDRGAGQRRRTLDGAAQQQRCRPGWRPAAAPSGASRSGRAPWSRRGRRRRPARRRRSPCARRRGRRPARRCAGR